MSGEDRVIVWCVGMICAVVAVGISWWGYFEVNEENTLNRTRRVVAEACQEEPDTDMVACSRDTMLVLTGKESVDEDDDG